MAKDKIQKTNAMRLLDAAKIPYSIVTYTVDPNDLGAQHIADQLGEDINRVFKTLVLHGERTGYLVCVIPGNAELDLKKVAVAAGDKKVEMIPMKQLLPLTGYIRGGCTSVGMKKQFPTYFHTTALDYPEIYVSAGQRGMQMLVSPQQLIEYVGATVAPLIKE